MGALPDPNLELSDLIMALRKQYKRLANNLADIEYRWKLWADILVKQERVAEMMSKIGDK